MARDLREIAADAADVCPGGWFWSGSMGRPDPGHYGLNHSRPYLACRRPGEGTCLVMGFKRAGMSSAQPTFPVGDGFHMKSGRELALYERTYRDEIVGFDSPVAEFMAAASPSVVLALLDRIAELETASAPCDSMTS